MANNYMARQDGSWTVVSLCPDVCKTPMGCATPPIPYSVIAFRQIQRTDYTNHGYGNPSAPDYHSNPHVHDYEYGLGYSPKGKQTRTNTGVN